MAGDGDPTFMVSVLPEARALLRGWGRLAEQRGLYIEYGEDLRRLGARLGHDPADFGDPLWDFTHAKLSVFRALTDFLIVQYGIHAEQRVVFVQSVRLRPDRPLGSHS